MKIAQVIGTVVATVKDPSIKGLKILMIQPLDEKYQVEGAPLAAIDTVQAGPRDIVYYTLARESALALPKPNSPVDAAITGIIDNMNLDERGMVDQDKIFYRGGS